MGKVARIPVEELSCIITRRLWLMHHRRWLVVEWSCPDPVLWSKTSAALANLWTTTTAMKAPAQISVRPQNSTRPITCQRIQTLKRHHRLWSAVRVAKALLQPLLWCQEKLLSNINSERGKHNSSMWPTTRINSSRSMPLDSSVPTPSKSKKSPQ